MFKKFKFLLVPVLAAALCSLLFWTSLDNKIFDLCLRALPSLTEDERVLVVKIDDGSIENVGIFPWTRDILADAIVFLKEMGARTVAFDLNFIDNSPVSIDPVYIENDLTRHLDNSFARINETVDQVMDNFAAGRLGRRDASGIKEDMKRFNNSVKNEIEISIGYLMRDLDAHFANTLQFFGSSYLTFTMVEPDTIVGDDISYEMDPEILQWLEDNIAIKNITAYNDSKTTEELGVVPSILKLMTRAGGAGFVNAIVDPDGYRRRANLLLKYNGHYYPHLSLAAMFDMLGQPSIEVSNDKIVLKDALINGTRADIVIPRTTDGSILVKWPKKTFAAYNTIPSWDLIRYNRVEADFVNNLDLMDNSNFFAFWDGDETPFEKYNNANYVKELLYKGEEGDINFDLYLKFRQDYLDSAGAFLYGPYEDAILQEIDDPETREFVLDVFDVTRDQYSQLLEIRETVSTQVRGTISIIGVDATGMTDAGLITFQEDYPNVGVYAAISNMLLSGEFLDDAPWYVTILIALVLSLFFGFFIKRLDVGKSILLGLSAMLFTAAALAVFFIITKRYIGVVVPFASVTLTFLSLTGLNFLSTAREKSFIRSAFSRYLAPEVIEQIISDPSKLNLGGEKREMTAVFTDVRSFSTISEALKDPKLLVDLLNHYLTRMSDIILANQGTVDKYEGDAIIAFFGAPIHYEDHAIKTCRAAVLMKKAETEINREVISQGLLIPAVVDALVNKKVISPGEDPIFTRIGINTGDMVVGNMGTSDKMNYTIMGDAVNLAARLEGVNKQYNTGGILISEYTRSQIGEEFIIRSLDRVRVVGINTPIRLFELLDIRSQGTQSLIDTIVAWENMIQLYEGRNFEGAQGLLQKIIADNPHDGPARIFLKRCVEYIKNPPSPDWDGVNNLNEK